MKWEPHPNVHPAVEMFPMMSDSELQELAADIKENGQHESITLWKGQLIDGRNRWAACQIAGVDPEEGELENTTDPIKWILSANIHRRNLTASQRASIATELANLLNGRASITRKQAAELLGTSTSTMDAVREIKKKSVPAVVDAIKSGELKVNTAKRFVDAVPDMLRQSEIIQQGPAAVKAAIKKPSAFAETWRRHDNRMGLVKELLSMMQPHERELLREWLVETTT